MMRKIKTYFVDFWKDFNPYNNFIYNDLSKRYDVEICNDPEYLFYSCFGFNHLKYNCVKIFYTGENLVPDFNFCDFAIGVHHLEFSDRYIRVPLSGRRFHLGNILVKDANPKEIKRRKFCNFVYSNTSTADPFREYFYKRLSEYKKIDSGGSLHNNIGGKVKDIIPFLADYKFTIAFENSEVEGYTTEKIVQPMSVNSIPVYWGNPRVADDFNVESFIWVKDKSEETITKAIERIIYLDNHEDEYFKVLSKPWLLLSQRIDYEKKISEYLDYIIKLPYQTALKRKNYGFIKTYSQNMTRIFEIDQRVNKKCRHFHRIFHIINNLKHVILLKNS